VTIAGTELIAGRGPRGCTAARLAPLLVALASAAGCGSNAPPPVELHGFADWNDDPATVDAIGYQVTLELQWPTRGASCFPLPSDLTVALNDHSIVPASAGDCADDFILPFDGVAPDAPVSVRVFSGSLVYGEATFDNLFPGFGAQLASGGASQVAAGGQVEVTLPATAVPVASNLLSGQFDWTAAGPSGVPFNTFARGMAGPDPQSVILTAPTGLTGSAIVVVKSVFQSISGTATSCTGFIRCEVLPDMQTAGPVSVDVISP